MIPRRRHPRRPAVTHRPPAPPTPTGEPLAAVEPVADVSRETSPEDPLTAHPDLADLAAELDRPAPPLTFLQVAKLEALTADWERRVRLEAPPDATMLYASPKLPPVPPPAQRATTPGDDPEPLPAADLAEIATVVDESWTATGTELAEIVRPARRVSSWVSRHDERSREFAVRDRLRQPHPVQTRHLERGPILDQGTVPPLSLRDASACVGMAWAAASNVLEAATASPYARTAETFRTALDARELYYRAQDLDGVTADAGTSVLAGAKAAREAGWIGTYLWALLGTRDIAQAVLQLGAPVVLGIPWGPALDDPDGAGIITPAGALPEGHAVTVVGILDRLTPAMLDRADPARVKPGAYFEVQQSRGESEGAGGLIYLHHTDLARLLPGRGEACVPLPRWVS